MRRSLREPCLAVFGPHVLTLSHSTPQIASSAALSRFTYAEGQAWMSLQIAVAHTGQRFDADPVAFTSVDALKHWISRATEIPPEQQVLLTTQGKHVKLQALLTEASCSCPTTLWLILIQVFAEGDICV